MSNRFHQSSNSSTYTATVSSFEHGEVIIVDSVNEEICVVSGVYRPPHCSLKTFLEKFHLYCDIY